MSEKQICNIIDLVLYMYFIVDIFSNERLLKIFAFLFVSIEVAVSIELPSLGI